ncbi:MAG: serine protease [Alphaproteobacteria bacterium]|nr:serine protease [Alphaproteobacteria bacterium]MDP6567716.1 serine protease [Alphaproteobacteria bacterium]MDP6812718.1 serine protease [Alphaproteobacteria bacterium]
MASGGRIFGPLALALAVSHGAAEAKDPVVYCLDKDRDQVSRVKAQDCRGEIIDKARADEIKAARVRRIQGIMRRGKPKPPAAGTKLASIGTGFFVTADGRLLTNNHVIDGCKALSVETPSGRRVKGHLLDRNVAFDLALVRAEMRPDAIITFRDPPALVLGERADLVGYPTQGIAPILPFHTEAELLAEHGRPGDRNRFQIKGDVRGGNSGGPVLDGSGYAIGVIFAQLNSVAIYKHTGKVPDDIGIAVANPVVFEFLRRNDVAYRVADSGPALDRPKMFKKARDFIVRVGCWR